MSYEIPGTESDPEIPQEFSDMVAQTIQMEAAKNGASAEEVAITFLTHLLGQRDRLSEEVEDKRIDPTTGVLVKAEILGQLGHMITGFEAGRRAFDKNNSVVIFELDIEEFRSFNNQHGFIVGDKALAATGAALRNLVSSDRGDRVGRIGGDEFLLIFPYDTIYTKAEEVVESVELRLRDIVFEQFPGLPSLRWNHAILKTGDKLEDLLSTADAKASEKNPHIKELVRSHSRNLEENKLAFEKAKIATLSN